MTKPRVAILGFGGTIAMVPDAGILKPAKSVEEIMAIVPSLKDMADVTFHELENRDSTKINPSHWTKLILSIQEIAGTGMDAIIVTHMAGTPYTRHTVPSHVASG